jgi:hypothetical protein
MNKKIIIFSCALVFVLQSRSTIADTAFNLMDREKLIAAAKQLEEKANSQQRRIAYLEKQVDQLSENQTTEWTKLCYQAQGAKYTLLGMLTVIGALFLKKKLTKRF